MEGGRQGGREGGNKEGRMGSRCRRAGPRRPVPPGRPRAGRAAAGGGQPWGNCQGRTFPAALREQMAGAQPAGLV